MTTKELQQRIIELEDENAQLRELCLVDPLTQIGNRRAMELFIEKLAKQAARRTYHRKVVLHTTYLMIDADHFKVYNDQYGHDTGDAVLREVAQLLAQNIRPRDVVFRFGGEEFVCIFQDTPIPDAAIIAERLRSVIEKHGVTVSIGVSDTLFSDDASDRSADACVYEAKAFGRNQVICQ